MLSADETTIKVAWFILKNFAKLRQSFWLGYRLSFDSVDFCQQKFEISDKNVRL